MFGKKKEEPKVIKSEPVNTTTVLIDNNKLQIELVDQKLQGLMRKVIEQEIIIRRLLDLVVMDIEHKNYSAYLLPQITKVKNLLDKIK